MIIPQMYYVSVEVGDIDDYCLEKDHIASIILMKKENIRMPFWLTLTYKGDWIVYDMKPQCILTEKCNALIHLCNIKKSNGVKELFSKYNITKFLLLKQILEKFILTDILQIIVDLSD